MEKNDKITKEIMEELSEVEKLSMVRNEITWGFTLGNGGFITRICC